MGKAVQMPRYGEWHEGPSGFELMAWLQKKTHERGRPLSIAEEAHPFTR